MGQNLQPSGVVVVATVTIPCEKAISKISNDTANVDGKLNVERLGRHQAMNELRLHTRNRTRRCMRWLSITSAICSRHFLSEDCSSLEDEVSPPMRLHGWLVSVTVVGRIPVSNSGILSCFRKIR